MITHTSECTVSRGGMVCDCGAENIPTNPAPTPRGITTDDIIARMGYHPGTPDVTPLYARTRSNAMEFATNLIQACPPGRELSLAITHVEEALMWANKAIAMTVPVDLDTPEVARVLPDKLESNDMTESQLGRAWS